MKKKFLKQALLALAGVGLLAGSAMALPVTVTYTTDNILSGAWYQKDAAATSTVISPLGPNAGSWWLADSTPLDLDYSSTYSIVWQVTNAGTSANPAAFLAEIDFGFGPKEYSSESWKYATTIGSVSNFSSGWLWSGVKAYGPNTAATSPWGGHSLLPSGDTNIAGIDEQAQWIWQGVAQPFPAGDRIYIKATFTTPAPEPATMLLLGAGIAGLAGMARRKRMNS